MNKTTFILLGVTYYIVSVLIIIIVLNKINKKEKNKYKQEIEELERDKNQIISSDIMSSLQTVEEFVNNDLMQEAGQGPQYHSFYPVANLSTKS